MFNLHIPQLNPKKIVRQPLSSEFRVSVPCSLSVRAFKEKVMIPERILVVRRGRQDVLHWNVAI